MLFTATDLSTTEPVLNHTDCTDEAEGLCDILKVKPQHRFAKGIPLMQGKGLLMYWDHPTGSDLGFSKCCNLSQWAIGPRSTPHLEEGIDSTVLRYTRTYLFPLDLEMLPLFLSIPSKELRYN